MKNQSDNIIRISRNCEEISAHNFFQMNKTKDFSWLIPGFDGWEEIAAFPIETPKHYENIINEYAELNENNSTLQYFELLADLTDEESRLISGDALLFQLATRWATMPTEVKKEYIKELHGHRFYFNEGKPVLSEIERIQKQFGTVQMKIETIKQRLKPFEKDMTSVDVIDVKITIQNILKRDIDLRRMSIKEFSKTLRSLTHKKAA